eukprot:g848.t1
MSLQQDEHRHKTEATREYDTMDASNQTVKNLEVQLKDAKTKIRRLRRENATMKIQIEASTNSFRSTVARAHAEKLASDAWVERAGEAGEGSDGGASRVETSQSKMLSELGSRLNDLAPDFALKMELIQRMRQQSRNSKDCDEVEEIIWLSIDKVLLGIEDIKTRLINLVVKDIDESRVVISLHDTIRKLNEKVLQQKEVITKMRSKCDEDQHTLSLMQEKVARMKKRNRQNHTESHGESMSDVVEKVMNRAKDQVDMF